MGYGKCSVSVWEVGDIRLGFGGGRVVGGSLGPECFYNAGLISAALQIGPCPSPVQGPWSQRGLGASAQHLILAPPRVCLGCSGYMALGREAAKREKASLLV